MRGKEAMVKAIESKVGITPAYAGKSDVKLVPVHAYRDHPRLCGEKWVLCHSTAISRGSPPPMRGKVPLQNRKDLAVRITPAYAGKSNILGGSCFVWWDHPRLCGEKKRKTFIM